MSIHALDKNLAVECVPVGYRDRPEDSPSKLNTYSDGFKVLKTIARLFKEYRPLPFFGILALVLIVVATVLFIPVLVEFFRTGLVPRFPTLIIAGVIAMSGASAARVRVISGYRGEKAPAAV